MVSIKAIKSLVTTPFLQNILMFLKVPLLWNGYAGYRYLSLGKIDFLGQSEFFHLYSPLRYLTTEGSLAFCICSLRNLPPNFEYPNKKMESCSATVYKISLRVVVKPYYFLSILSGSQMF